MVIEDKVTKRYYPLEDSPSKDKNGKLATIEERPESQPHLSALNQMPINEQSDRATSR